MKCGREPGGIRSEELGICPASTEMKYNDVNSGDAPGRICWAVAGTLCGGVVQGTFAKKFEDCLKCPFLLEVINEEGDKFIMSEKDIKE
jgi:hypothetical protein